MPDPVILQLRHVAQIEPAAPFNFDATIHKPDHFPSADNLWQPGVRWQTMLWQNTPVGLKYENRGATDQPCILLSVWSEETLEPAFIGSLVAEISFRCYFNFDLTDFNTRFGSDPDLGPIIHQWWGMRPVNFGSLYEYLIVAIVLQNATVRRSVSMMQALFEQYGTLLTYDGKALYGFWPPEVVDSVTEEELRALRVGYRAKSIKRVTEAFVRKEIDEFELRTRSWEEQRQTLLRLYGIGRASVGYILGDVFHRLGEMVHISPWEQRIYSKLFFDQQPEDPVPVDTLLRFFDDRFAPYQMLAVHYVWEDLFWRHRYESVPWLETLIRL
jgi:3-methyladenine DNA glycosylase/8-oxoguanine DNA glycosylase